MPLGPNAFARPVNVVTSNYTATTDDGCIIVDATGGAVTVTLPPATQKGLQLSIAKADSSINTVTMSRAGSDTIKGLLTFVTSLQYTTWSVIADGTSTWYQL